MKIIRLIIAGIFIIMGFLAFSQSPGNFSTLRVNTLNGNMKANGTSLVTADTVLLKADTLRADAELYVRDSTLLQIIQANSSVLEVVGNVNNRVLTATGGDSIQGEGNLTFNGTTLLIHNGISGQTPNAQANTFVVDGSASINGISILSGTTGAGNIYFGDATSNNRGQLRFDHTADRFIFNKQNQITATTNQIRLGTDALNTIIAKTQMIIAPVIK